MGATIQKKNIEDYIADLNRRIDRMESGGKPMVAITNRARVEVTLTAGSTVSFGFQFGWANTAIEANPGAVPHISIFVDNDNNTNYIWPVGASLSGGQKSLEVTFFSDDNLISSFPNKSQALCHIKNNDTVSHTLYIYLRFTYIKGVSGGA